MPQLNDNNDFNSQTQSFLLLDLTTQDYNIISLWLILILARENEASVAMANSPH